MNLWKCYYPTLVQHASKNITCEVRIFAKDELRTDVAYTKAYVISISIIHY